MVITTQTSIFLRLLYVNNFIHKILLTIIVPYTKAKLNL
jgi:hypothetical protein